MDRSRFLYNRCSAVALLPLLLAVTTVHAETVPSTSIPTPTQSNPALILQNDPTVESKWYLMFDSRTCTDKETFGKIISLNNRWKPGDVETAYCGSVRMAYIANIPYEVFWPEVLNGMTRDGDAPTVVYEPLTSAITVVGARQMAQAMVNLQFNAGTKTLSPSGVTGSRIDGSPLPISVTQTLVQSSIKSFGGSTDEGGIVQFFPSPLGGWAYHIDRQVSGLTCSRIVARTFRCKYRLTKTFVPETDDIFGIFKVAMMPAAERTATYMHNDTFTVGSGPGWISPTIDASNAASARALQKWQKEQQQAAQSSSKTPAFGSDKWWQQENDRRFEERRVEREAEACRFDAFVAGAPAMCLKF